MSEASEHNEEGVPSYMGTMEEARGRFLFQYDRYCEYQGAVIGSPKQLRQHDAAKREAELRFMLAGANLAWHMLNNAKATGASQ
jgi:hypothetical protein